MCIDEQSSGGMKSRANPGNNKKNRAHEKEDIERAKQ
jgi:hypothetical protein